METHVGSLDGDTWRVAWRRVAGRLMETCGGSLDGDAWRVA